MLHHVGIEVAPEDVERLVELWKLLGARLTELNNVARSYS